MIKAKSLHIQEFRGIKDLVLDLEGENFAVCGPNGTGKSGIVDALEFVLTGSVSRLSGRGMGELSVKKHAPHVDCAENPEKANVSLFAFIPSLNQEIVIRRCVDDADVSYITPNTPAIINYLKSVALHPEFVLSRRELIRYILSAPGERHKEVQILLRLERVEEVRSTLKKIANSCEREVKNLAKQREESKNRLQTGLKVENWSASEILKAVNPKRAILGLPEINELSKDIKLDDGATDIEKKNGNRLSKTHAIESAEDLRKSLVALHSHSSIASATESLSALKTDPSLDQLVTEQHLLQTAIKLIRDDQCPVCDTEWDTDKLRCKVEEKLIRLKGVAGRLKDVGEQMTPLLSLLRAIERDLDGLTKIAAELDPVVNCESAIAYRTRFVSERIILEKLHPIEDTLLVLRNLNVIPKAVEMWLSELSASLQRLPDPTKTEEARQFLVVAQERYDVYRNSSRQLQGSEEKSNLACVASDTYGQVSSAKLNDIYETVEKDFARLYRSINTGDEVDFEAALLPSIGRLGFNVDFYGRGKFPPGAYHSEGHQDGMGLCLYLALMKYLLGEKFCLAVLDDVLMSVDAGHRREVCKMLREHFPNTQFVLTTHDEVWLKHMVSAGLVKRGRTVHFRKWDVDHGPADWKKGDIWGEIDEALKLNEVSQAAGSLRRYLEHISAELCHRLRARVEYRSDQSFTLGDLLPNSTSKMRKLLETGKKAAHSWGQADKKAFLEAREVEFLKIFNESQVENWAVNSAVHYNSWANLTKQDFEPVVLAFKKLLATFECESCSELLYVTPEKGETEALRCGCGQFNINLLRKG